MCCVFAALRFYTYFRLGIYLSSTYTLLHTRPHPHPITPNRTLFFSPPASFVAVAAVVVVVVVGGGGCRLPSAGATTLTSALLSPPSSASYSATTQTQKGALRGLQCRVLLCKWAMRTAELLRWQQMEVAPFILCC
jgi:hypothetical protein